MLTSCTVDNNTAHVNGAGIAAAGELQLYNTTVRNSDKNHSVMNGASYGGLYNAHAGKIWISNSTMSDNKASRGGGIVNQGEINIVNSTISGNETGNGGGGGIMNYWKMNIANSTISGNIGEGILNFGLARLNSVTITKNTGNGVVNDVVDGEFYFANTIIANNDREDCTGRLITQGGNLVGDRGGFFDDAGKLVENKCDVLPPQSWDPSWPSRAADKLGPLADGVFVVSINPLLLPLDHSDGGLTETHRLCLRRGYPHASCSGKSPAVNAAWPGAPNDPHNPFACEAYDQSGFMRVDGHCDIGAVEAH